MMRLSEQSHVRMEDYQQHEGTTQLGSVLETRLCGLQVEYGCKCGTRSVDHWVSVVVPVPVVDWLQERSRDISRVLPR